MVAYGPRLLQAVLAAVADVHFYQLAIRLIGHTTAKWAVSCSDTHPQAFASRYACQLTGVWSPVCPQLLCYACNWFLLYTLVRTYSNSLETALSLIALAYWP